MSPELATIIVSSIGTGGTIAGIYLAHKLNQVKKEATKSKEEVKQLRHLFNKKNNRVISIFLLDNEASDAQLVIRRLAKIGYAVESFEEENELFSKLTNSINIYLIDYYLRRLSALEVVREIKKMNYYNYIIVLSGHKNEEMLYNLSNSGIAKFVYKNDADYLEKIEMYVNEAVEIISNL